MAAFEELIGELRSAGELDSVGEFTLDRRKAREKMRLFQLADPRSYVLELVQAAVLAGASEARFEIDADDMRMTFDGRPFTVEDFEELYGAMFTHRESAAARRQLAIGLNAAMALDPKLLHVESGTARMEMRADADEITTAKKAVAGTRIHVRDRFGNATLVRFVLKLRGHVTEMLYLKERCRHAPLAIHLNGDPISGELSSGGKPLAEADGRIRMAKPGTSIVAGFARESRPARLMILDQGVWIATHELDSFPYQFVACVESVDLRKDVSQRDVVRDEAYARILESLPAAFYRALASLAALVRENSLKEPLFRQLLFHPATLALIEQVLAGIQGSAAAQGDAAARTVAAVPLWPSARGPRFNLSLLDLLHIRTWRGRVGWAHNVNPELERRNEPPVPVITAQQERNWLERLFDDSFYPADSQLQHELVRARNVQRWHRRRMAPEIPASQGSLASMPLATAEVTGEVGVFLDPFRHSEGYGKFPVWLIKEGGLLEKAVVTPAVRGFTAALEADFKPAEDFAHVAIDRLYVRVVIALAHALGPLMDRLASESSREDLVRNCLISYLGLDWRADGLRDHLKHFGITDKKHLAYAQRLLEENPLAPISVDGEDAPGAAAPPLTRFPLFATLQGPRLSLGEIAARPGDRWLYLPETPSRAGSESPAASPSGEAILLLDSGELAAFRQVFPDKTLQDHSAAHRRESAAAEHLQKPPLILAAGGVEQTELESDGIRGRLGLMVPKDLDVPVQARLQMLKNDRFLGDVHYQVPIGPIVGMINDDELTPTADWSGVEPDDRLTRVRRLVLEAAAKLVRDVCESYRAAKGFQRDRLRGILCNAAARLLATEVPLADWSASRVLPDEVTAEDWTAELTQTLESVPLFRDDLDVESIDLKTIRDILDRDDTLLCRLDQMHGSAISVEEELELLGERPMLRLTENEHEALARIFGSYRLTDARQGFLARLQGRELAAAAPLDRVELSDLQVLVKVGLTGLRGEVGLRRQPNATGLELALHKDGRHYVTSKTAAPHALVATVDDDALALDERGLLDPDDDRPAELARLCLARVPELIGELVADQELWRASFRDAALFHFVHYLASEANREGERDEDGQRLWEAATELPVFRGVDQTYSYTDLCRSYEIFGRQAVLPWPADGEPADRRRCVLVVLPPERALVQRLFPEIEDISRQWQEEQRLRQRLDFSPALPKGPPANALVARKARGRRGLEAHLWLPVESDGRLVCAFGFAGRQLEIVSISDLFPCAGVIAGDDVIESGGVMTDHQRDGFERQAFRLYKQLAKDFSSPARGRELGGDRARAAGRLLARAHHALNERFIRDYATLDDDYVNLFTQLEEMAPFEVEEPEIEDGVPPSREARLLRALRTELRWAGKRHVHLLDERNLDRLALGNLQSEVIASCQRHGVTVNRRQPLVETLLAEPEIDPVQMAFLASAVYTAMNYFWQEIEDDHEREFQGELIAGLLDRSGNGDA